MLLVLSALSVIAGDLFAKYWSANQKALFLIIALLSYFLSGLFYIPTLLREGLVVTSVVYSLLSIIGFMFIGLVLFKETLTQLQLTGVFFGVVALIIFAFSFR